MLLVLDGWGISDTQEHNAIVQANTPNFDYLWNNFPHVRLEAAGESVGLPKGQMGNSEVGHLSIGSGRIVYQNLARINNSIECGLLGKSSELARAFEKNKKFNSTLHIKGLISSGGVHSHLDHLYALIDLAKKAGVPRVFIHAFTDGRDTPPKSAEHYLKELENVCQKSGIACIASMSGRYYAMDRDNNWDRTQCAFAAISKGEGMKYSSVSEAIKENYAAGKTDEFIEPCVFPVTDEKKCEVADHDVMIFFNFRSDRAKQLAKRFREDCHANDFTYLTMTDYGESLSDGSLFGEDVIAGNLAEVISQNDLRQLRIAETEKFAHVTYFFNGGKEEPYDGEDRKLIPSNKLKTHDMSPEMKTEVIADSLIEEIKQRKYDFVLANFANLDMVGHSGLMDKTILAVESVDLHLGRIVKAVGESDYTLIVTADHGNAEKMFDSDICSPHTAHTVNDVPFIIMKKGLILAEKGKLSDVAPTIIQLMALEKPAVMTGSSLIKLSPTQK